MFETPQWVATLSATLFAGAALYINVAEHPARMTLETKAAALQWAPSYRRATLLQAPLAVISFLAGVAVWWQTGATAWIVAAALIGAVVPFTFIAVMPTNRSLLDPQRDLDSRDTRDLLRTWNRLHAVRTVLSRAAAILYLLLLQND